MCFKRLSPPGREMSGELRSLENCIDRLPERLDHRETHPAGYVSREGCKVELRFDNEDGV